MTPSESLSYKLHAFRQAGAFFTAWPWHISTLSWHRLHIICCWGCINAFRMIKNKQKKKLRQICASQILLLLQQNAPLSGGEYGCRVCSRAQPGRSKLAKHHSSYEPKYTPWSATQGHFIQTEQCIVTYKSARRVLTATGSTRSNTLGGRTSRVFAPVFVLENAAFPNQ